MKQRVCDPTPAQRIDSLRAHEKWRHPGLRFGEPPAADQCTSTIGFEGPFDAAKRPPWNCTPTWRLVHGDKEQALEEDAREVVDGLRNQMGRKRREEEGKGLFLGCDEISWRSPCPLAQ